MERKCSYININELSFIYIYMNQRVYEPAGKIHGNTAMHCRKKKNLIMERYDI